MCKVGDEHPRRRVADASEEGYGEHEPPAFAQGTSQRVGSQHPHAGPQGEHEGVVLDAAWNPLAPEPECFGSSAESRRDLGLRVITRAHLWPSAQTTNLQPRSPKPRTAYPPWELRRRRFS